MPLHHNPEGAAGREFPGASIESHTAARVTRRRTSPRRKRSTADPPNTSLDPNTLIPILTSLPAEPADQPYQINPTRRFGTHRPVPDLKVVELPEPFIEEEMELVAFLPIPIGG